MILVMLGLVAVGGAIGSAMRHGIGLWLERRVRASLLRNTFLVNVGGAFLLGLFLALAGEAGAEGAQWLSFLGLGIMGGFTVFSALSLESTQFVAEGASGPGVLNVLASGAAGIVAVLTGLALGRTI